MLSRRSFIFGAAGTAAAGVIGCSESDGSQWSTSGRLDCPALEVAEGARAPLWKRAFERAIVYGSSTATWQLSDATYRQLFAREAAILFTEDDLLWYRLRPTPQSDLDFGYADMIIGFAEEQGMLVFGAHLVWDEGFGEGWTHDDLWGMDAQAAGDLILETITRVVGRYRGRVTAWSVANEVLDGSGLRTDVPWYETIGPSYVAESFRVASEADPDATLVLNDFGYETDDDFASAADKRAATLQLLDELIDARVPVHALGVSGALARRRLRRRLRCGGLSPVPVRGGRPRPEDSDHRDGRSRRRSACEHCCS